MKKKAEVKTLEMVQAEIAELKKVERKMKADQRRENLARLQAERAKNDSIIANGFRQFCRLKYGDLSDEEIIEKINHIVENTKKEK